MVFGVDNIREKAEEESFLHMLKARDRNRPYLFTLFTSSKFLLFGGVGQFFIFYYNGGYLVILCDLVLLGVGFSNRD